LKLALCSIGFLTAASAGQGQAAEVARSQADFIQGVVTGSADDTAKVWDAESGRELLTLRGHNGSVGSAVFFPDGRRILTGGTTTTQPQSGWQLHQKEVDAWRKTETSRR